MKYVCPECHVTLEIIEANISENICPQCGNIMQVLKQEKYDPELDRMILIISREGSHAVWENIEDFKDWHYRVKMRKLFFNAIKNLGIPFQPNWEE